MVDLAGFAVAQAQYLFNESLLSPRLSLLPKETVGTLSFLILQAGRVLPATARSLLFAAGKEVGGWQDGRVGYWALCDDASAVYVKWLLVCQWFHREPQNCFPGHVLLPQEAVLWKSLAIHWSVVLLRSKWLELHGDSLFPNVGLNNLCLMME